jgi:uncharacterized protein YutE (UPF0331/DUF86 family)
MIDKERVRRRLLDLERYSDRLGKMLPGSMALYKKSDTILKSAVERNLQLISDIEIELLVLLYKGMELSLAGDDSSVIERLAGKLSGAALSGVRNRRNLRNLLVHAYSDTSYDDEAFDQASSLSDVRGLIKEVNRILEKQ